MLLVHNTLVLALLLGGVVGLIVGLSGAGGGVFAVPLLVFGLNLPVRDAAPVGLIAVGIAAGIGAALGLLRGIVRYRAAALIGVCGIVMAPAGLWLAQRIPNPPLMIVFSLILAWVGIQTLRRTFSPRTRDMELRAAAPCRTAPSSGRFIWNLPCARMLSLTGLLSGLLSGLLGVGGGFVIVPALTRYTNLNTQSVIATSLGVIALVSGGSVAAAAVGGSIAWPIAVPFAGGAVAGMLAGRMVAARLAGERLQQGFAVTCLVVASLMIARVAGWLS